MKKVLKRCSLSFLLFLSLVILPYSTFAAGTKVVWFDLGTKVAVNTVTVKGSGTFNNVVLYDNLTTISAGVTTDTLPYTIGSFSDALVNVVSVTVGDTATVTSVTVKNKAGVVTATSHTLLEANPYTAPSPTPIPTGTDISLVRGGNTVVPKMVIVNYADPREINSSDLLPYEYNKATSK
jgi:hypothetical protein